MELAEKIKEDLIKENTDIANFILNKEYNTRVENKLEAITELLLEFRENEEILRIDGVFDFYYDVGGMSRAYTNMPVSADRYTRIDYLSLVQVVAREIELNTENEQKEIIAVSVKMNDALPPHQRFKVLRVEKIGTRIKAFVLDEENENAVDVFIFWG
jgi:hypothetical protein